MARLKYSDIKQEIENAGWQLLTQQYTNLDTDMHFLCPEGHNNYYSLKQWRHGHKCLMCENNPLKNIPTQPVKKNGFRIFAVDQASITSGFAIFDNDELITYGHWSSNGNHSTEKISQMKAWFACMIEKWKPDLVVLEDIQYQQNVDGVYVQNNILTYKKLAALQGVLKNYCYETGIIYKVVPSATWRSYNEIKGRALWDKEKIPTPSGWKQIQDIQVGDYIFDAKGLPTLVKKIIPQKKQKIYQVKFKDGRKIYCSEDHLWSFNTLSQKPNSKINRKFYTYSTKEIGNIIPLTKNRSNNILVPVTCPVAYETKNFFIPPYLFGLFLGDGSFRETHSGIFQFSSENEYLPRLISNTMNWDLHHHDSNFTWYFSYVEKRNLKRNKNVKVSEILKDFPELRNKKSIDKYIPKEYLQGDIQQRFDLLRGLLDTDGTCTENGKVKFTTISSQLAKDFQELCYSLGLMTGMYISPPRGFGKNESYNITISASPEVKKKFFLLPRKKERVCAWYSDTKNKKKNMFNPIVQIDETDIYDTCTCFEVDNDEHLFLAGDYIPTHNCRTDKKRNAQLKVKKIYDINVSQDEADAILIGRWSVEDRKKSEMISFE